MVLMFPLLLDYTLLDEKYLQFGNDIGEHYDNYRHHRHYMPNTYHYSGY
jgi:hypothetical protein